MDPELKDSKQVIMGEGNWSGTSKESLLWGPFPEKEKEYFTFFFLPFLSSATTPEKVIKANTIVCQTLH